MEKGSVSILFVLAALEPVRARGLDVDELLHRAGIAPTLLLAPGGRVSAQHFGALWLEVARVLDDELFGQDSRRMKAGTFAMLCRVLVQCGTLEDALRRMVQFFNLVLDDFHCSLESDARDARLVIRHTAATPAPPVLGYETLLMMQHGLACWLVGRRIPILSASFAYPQPERSTEYAGMYCSRLLFMQAVTSISFARSHLALPVIQDAHTVKDFIQHAPSNFVIKYKNSSGLAAQIRRRLRTVARDEWPDFEQFAQKFNMTPSTLRRRLDEEGQAFQVIKDHLRRDMAIEYLCHTSKSVAQIATELGFSEASAFHRAFKKWTGAAPGEYRQSHH